MKPVLTLTVVVALCVSAVMLSAPPVTAPVADAAMHGDRNSVRSLLKQGADVNAAQPDGMTALHWAADRGDAELAGMLLYAGANPNAMTRIGEYTPLHVASRDGNAAVIKMLLEKGADAAAKTTNSGVTPLHLAAASGNIEAVSALLEKKVDVNAKENEWGQTPLTFAAAQNRADVIKVLIQHGANPNISSKSVDIPKESQLAAAASERQRQVIASYGKRGQEQPSAAEVQAAVLAGRELYASGVIPPGLVVARGGRGGGGGAAAANGDDGAPPAITTKGGMTPLLHAARQGYAESVKALVAGGANINEAAGDGTTPLLIAIINAEYDTAIELVKLGANPNRVAFNGVGPLWAAVNAEWQPRTRYPQPQEHGLQKSTYLDVLAALLDGGADPNLRVTTHPWYLVYSGCGNPNCGLEDTAGSTAFWRAAYATDVDAMKLLVSRGANPNIPTKAPSPKFANRSGTEFFKADEEAAKQLKPFQPVAPGLWPATDAATVEPDPSGLAPVPQGGPGVFPIHAASGVGYGQGFAGNAHRHAPDAWMAAVKYLIEELGADVNQRDNNGYTPLHDAASRGDDEMIMYLVSKGADVKVIARTGQTTADMANGPVSRLSPFPKTVALLESLGSKNNHRCVGC
jgi:ankyrin repeat protein